MNKTSLLLAIIFYIILFFPSSVVFSQTNNNEKKHIIEKIVHPWKQWQKKNDLSVSYRPTQHPSLIEIKTSAIIKSSISAFLLFIQDVKNTPKWLANAKSSEVLKQISDNENIFTVNFNGFLFVEPRKLILHSRYWQNDNLSVEIILRSESLEINNQTSLLVNEHNKSILVTLHSAHWIITPFIDESNQKQLKIEYSFIADSGGSMPEWFTEHVALKSIWKTMKNIKHQLPESHWQQKTLNNIRELP